MPVTVPIADAVQRFLRDSDVGGSLSLHHRTPSNEHGRADDSPDIHELDDINSLTRSCLKPRKSTIQESLRMIRDRSAAPRRSP